MKVKDRPGFVSFDFFLVRRPYFSVNLFCDLHGLSPEGDSSFLSSFKVSIAQNGSFLEALYLASPVLHERTQQWLAGETISEEAQLVRTLYKYWGRICSRATPYGLFAGVSLGQWGNSTRIIPDKSKDQVFNELDILHVNQIIDTAFSNYNLSEKSLFYVNNSIYQVGKEIRYVEYVMEEAGAKYFLTSMGNSDQLQGTLSLAKNGCYLSDLRKHLCKKGLSEVQSTEFVNDLVEFQLLTSDLRPRITTTNGLRDLIRKLETAQADRRLLQTLEKTTALLQSGSDRTAAYDDLRILMQHNFPGIINKNLVQTTLQQGYSQMSIDQSFGEKLSSNLSQLRPLFQGQASPNLRTFKKEFYDKYGSAEIPLSVALDGEIGIDYGHASRLSNISVLDGLDLTPGTKSPLQFGEWDQFLLAQYLKFTDAKADEISLSSDDIMGLTAIPSINPSFYAFGNIIDESKSGKEGLTFNLTYIGGNSAAALMARFAGSNAALHAKLLEITAYEQSCFPDVILAEIVFLPESRTGNVLSHPSLYNFEIPYITLSSVDEAHQLPVDDLLISSTPAGKITLRSKKFGKQVIPRLSNAHYYGSELPIYQFLCDLQSDSDNINFKWTWSVLKDRPVLPRVTFDNVILSRKTWNIDKTWSKKLEQFILHYNVPRYVQLIEGDNELLLDLKLSVGKTILADEIEKKGKAELREFLQTPERCIIADQDGPYTNELIIPFKAVNHKPISSATYNTNAQDVQRKFSFGDEWLYVQIYAGPTIIDKILIEMIKPFCNHLLESSQIEKWFFVRYQDPRPHIRLRFLSKTDPAGIADIVMQLRQQLAPLMGQQWVEKFVLDTYDRELERYGAKDIELAESIFFIDSQFALNALTKITQHQADEYRWLYACKAIDCVLDAFGLCLEEKAAVTKDFARSFLGSHEEKDKVEIRLNEKFRLLRKEVTTGMETAADYADEELNQLAMQFSKELKALITNTKNTFGQDQIASFVHMSCNRLFISESREQELLVYHFLSKYYKGKSAQLQALYGNR